jgi:hypothetical protein
MDKKFAQNQHDYKDYFDQVNHMLCLTRVMKENLKSEKAKVMLTSVKDYYT